MRLLLDTHVLLWFRAGRPEVDGAARSPIADPANTILVSLASYWEIAIKIGARKYVLNEPYEDFMRRAIEGNNMAVLAIEPRHTAGLISLPHHHRDPFDRLLIAQATRKNIPIVSADATFDEYGVPRLW